VFVVIHLSRTRSKDQQAVAVYNTTGYEEHMDPASMAAARVPGAPPRPDRDGFHLIDDTPLQFDDDRGSAFLFLDITYHVSTADQTARIAFNRPHVLHAFRPRTIREIQTALTDATDDPHVAVILLTSNNSTDSTTTTTTTTTDYYTDAFCAGGDQTVRATTGYQDETEVVPALRVLDLQVQMRRCPKPIVAVVQGYAIGGGHILHMVADLTIAADNAVFGQTGPRMGSFDAGYGSALAAAHMGQKRARELWFLGRFYSAEEAYQMGLVNTVVPVPDLPRVVARWARRMVMNSPTAIACCKAALNATDEQGIAQMGGELTRLFYQSRESQEGRQAFLERRAPRFRSKL
jgi:naphthoate synthase